ncbi:hypothetical protein EIK77_008464 [Talaromyces pinophilus]|nr:hypothetical protein EIK77_008464 [Talaromyces pinophilus]
MTPEIMSQAETLALPSEALPILTNGESTQTNIPNGLKNSITTKNPSQLNIKDTPVENFRRMRVVVIGAGFSGIYLGVRIPQRLRNVELAIYEKNDDVGGTWGPEIHQYLKGVVKRYSVDRFVKLSHQVLDVEWHEDVSKWSITIQNRVTGETFVDKADVVISARGTLNDISWPDIPGLKDMKIPVMHSAAWDDKYEIFYSSVSS